MATKKTGGTNSEENLNAVAEQLRKAAELLESSGVTEKQLPADTQEQEKPKATKSTAAKKPAAKSTTSKSTAAKKPASKSTSAKSTSTKSTASKSTSKSAAAKKPAAKKTATEDDEVAKLKAELEATKQAQADAEAAKKAAEEEAARHAAQAAKANANAEAEIAKANAEAEIAKAQAEAEKAKAAANADAEIAKANAEAEIAKANAEAEIAKANAEAEAAAATDTEEPKAEEKPVEAEQAPAPVENKKGAAKVAYKTNEFIHGKGKLPIFIVTNALFFVSAILLMLNAISITGQGDTVHYYTIFSFLAKGSEVKTYLVAMAGDWANGAYTLLGIFMWIAFILPLPFLVKNIIMAVRKKSFEVYKFDAVVFYAFMLFYLALVNLCGANVTFGLIAAFIVSAVDLVFVFLMQFITKSVKDLPFFSFGNIFLATLTILILCGPTAKFNGVSLYAALTSDITGGGGIFVFILFAIVALIALIIMQIWRLPKIVQIIIPLAAPVLAIIALITLSASVPNITGSFAGTKISGQFVFGFILTVITAVANTLFTFLKPLNKYRKMAADSLTVNVSVNNSVNNENNVVVNEATPATEEKAEAPAEEKAEEKPAEQPAEDNEPKVFCAACGEANSPSAAYCKKCGHRM